MPKFVSPLKFLYVNYQKKGGFAGLLGLVAIIATVIAPPWAVLELFEVQPYTLMRLVVPFVWSVYLVPGVLASPERLSPRIALSIAIWPLRKS